MNSLWFINPNRNDKFSKLNKLELHELLTKLDNFYLIYRENLDLPETVSFGVELEYQNISNEKVKEYLKNHLSTWKFVEEKTLEKGGEINSPIMFDKINYWKELKKICEYLKQNNANVDTGASTHVHVGVQTLGSNIDNWRKFIKSYIVYESILSRFFYGDKINARVTLMDYAYPIADILYTEIDELNKLKNIEDMIYLIPRRQFQAIDFRKIKFYDLDKIRELNTLEFRSPNGTKEEIICQNNINAITKLLLSTKKDMIDEEYLDYKLNNERITSTNNYSMYSNMNLELVLEFVDMIFDNNIDKVYFLRQYIKDKKEYINADEAIYSKKFIK